MIGREPELAPYRDLLSRLRDGSAATLLIEGEAGIGKSSLVRALADEARQAGVRVHMGEGHPLEHRRPFGLIVDALDLRRRSADCRRAAIGALLMGEDDSVPGGPMGDRRYLIVEDVLDLLARLATALGRTTAPGEDRLRP